MYCAVLVLKWQPSKTNWGLKWFEFFFFCESPNYMVHISDLQNVYFVINFVKPYLLHPCFSLISVICSVKKILFGL